MILSRFSQALGLALCVALTGCAITSNPPSAAPGVALSGRFAGGQQPIGNVSVRLYAAGATGNGTGAVNLLRTPVFTASNGSFSITGDYTCPSASTQVYLAGFGGNPGISAGTNNTASVLMAALGDCGNLSASTFIYIDEVTTAAAAWALAQFLGPNANIGASSTNASGLRNAFLVANNLANTTTGTAGGTTLPPGATLEAAKLNTLANALAACVNSSGGASCSPLFNAATAGGSTPTNTLDAALSIVRHPGNQVAAVFNAATPAPPFQPALTQAPNDWTMSVTYTGGGLASPTAVAVDSRGNVWAANYYGGSASKLSVTGAPAAPTGFADPALFESYGIAIDRDDSVWITNEESSYSANNGNGTVSKFASGGQLASGPGFSAGGIYFPYAIASDTNGSMWVADYGHSQASLLAYDGSSLAGASGYTSAALPLPVGVAIDSLHNAWFASERSASRVTPAGAVTQYPCCHAPSAIAVDPGNAVWITDYSASALVQLSQSGSVLQTLTGSGGLYFPESLAIDGAGAVWVANFRGNSVSAFGGAAGGQPSATLSLSTGFGPDAALLEPFGIALDASGDVWIANFGSSSLTQFVGLATPIKTPLLGPPAQP